MFSNFHITFLVASSPLFTSILGLRRLFIKNISSSFLRSSYLIWICVASFILSGESSLNKTSIVWFIALSAATIFTFFGDRCFTSIFTRFNAFCSSVNSNISLQINSFASLRRHKAIHIHL